MAIRVKCSIMSIINAPFRGVEDSLNNPAYFSIFNFHLSLYSMTSRWVEAVSGVRRVTK